MGETVESYDDVLEEAASLITSEHTGVERVYEDKDVIAEIGNLQYKIAFISKYEHAQFGSDRLSDSFKEDLQRLGPWRLLLAIHEQENESSPVGPALTQIEFRQLVRQLEANMLRLNEIVRRVAFCGPAILDGNQDRIAMEGIGWPPAFPAILYQTRLADWMNITPLVDEGKAWISSIRKSLVKMSQSMCSTSPGRQKLREGPVTVWESL